MKDPISTDYKSAISLANKIMAQHLVEIKYLKQVFVLVLCAKKTAKKVELLKSYPII